MYEVVSYSNLAVNDSAHDLASRLIDDMTRYNRLRPAARDYILGYSRAVYHQGSMDDSLISTLYLVLTFYPTNEQLLLLLGCVNQSSGRPIVSLYLNRELLAIELVENRTCVEAMSNMAIAYASLVRLLCLYDFRSDSDDRVSSIWRRSASVEHWRPSQHIGLPS